MDVGARGQKQTFLANNGTHKKQKLNKKEDIGSRGWLETTRVMEFMSIIGRSKGLKTAAAMQTMHFCFSKTNGYGSCLESGKKPLSS